MLVMLVLMSDTFALISASMPLRSSTCIVRRTVYGAWSDVVVSHSTSMRRSGSNIRLSTFGQPAAVDRHALAARDVADDLLAANRIAALRAEHHDVVGAAHLDLVARRARAQHALDDRDDRGIGWPFFQLTAGHGLLQHRARRQLAVADVREQFVRLLRAVLRSRTSRARRSRARVFGLRSKRRASLSNSRRPSSMLRVRSSPCSTCLILLRARELTTKRQPVAARLVPGLRDDLDDVAVLQAGAQRHHLAVDARADALVADVGVNHVREVDRRRAARQRSAPRPSA